MALDSYSNLQTAITVYARRQGDTAFEMAVPDFIALCHSKVNKQIRTREMEETTTITMTDGVGALPSDYLQYRKVTVGDIVLEHAGSGWGDIVYRGQAGQSRYFTIKGSDIHIFPQSDDDVVMDYYARIPALSGSNPTNWILENHPEIYLYGALIEASPFMQDDERVAIWAAMYENAMTALVGADVMSKHARPVSRVSGPTP